MVFKIVLKPIVLIDLDEAISWYEAEQNGLGEQFFNSFVKAKDKIKKNPHRYPNIIPKVKRVLLKKFPYKLFYTYTENTVIILGVTHAKRSNAYLRKRLKSL